MSDDAVVVEELVKRYPKRPTNAVDGVSFTVRRAEIFGLLGPNGAGKTTTIGVLTTRVRPTGGRAVVGGVDVARDPVAAKRRLAVVPQRPNLDRALSARQILTFHGAYFGASSAEREARANTLLAEFGLADRGSDKVDRFSGGQSQRLMIARALMHDPEVLFLDEPTTGLDPQARLFVWDRVRDMRARGVTVLLTTHDMDEAAELADRVGIMDNGRLLALDTPDALTAGIAGSCTLEVAVQLSPGDGAQPVLDALAAVGGVDHVERVTRGPSGRQGEFGGFGPGAASPSAEAGEAGEAREAREAPSTVRVRLYGTGDAATLLVPVTQALAANAAAPIDLALGKPTLEDVFISLTGRGLRA